MSEEKRPQKKDHLMDFLKENENAQPEQISNSVQQFGDNSRQKVDAINTSETWLNIPLKDLPYGKFYPIGTHISIKPVTTKEIEAFAIVNDKNPYDVQLKLNEILTTCTKIVYLDGRVGNYKDIQNGDRDTLAIIIAKASAKNGRKIEKAVVCSCNKEEQMIEMIPANYVYKEESLDIADYFNENTRRYEFPLENGDTVYLAPPSIGLTEDINNYIFYQTTKSQGKVTPNITFMQTIPYIKAGKGVKTLTIEELEQEEYNFSKMNEELFMFIYDAIDLMSFGIETVKTNCVKCGTELATHFTFPGGARALYVVPNAFKQFIRQRV